MHQNQNELDELWEYVEPDESGGTCYVRMTKRQAINWMKKYIVDHYPKQVEVKHYDDEKIFNDWVVVNWAYKYEKENRPS